MKEKARLKEEKAAIAAEKARLKAEKKKLRCASHPAPPRPSLPFSLRSAVCTRCRPEGACLPSGRHAEGCKAERLR